jgi:ATP-dependent RNA helicase DHX29
MAKKKKTQLKPVARGFATTSVAKKVVPEVEPEEAEVVAPEAADAQQSITDDTNATQPSQAPPQSLDAEVVALQELVDKLQDRVEREVTRSVKVRHISSLV